VRYRAEPPAALLVEPLDTFVAVFHRTSGITHLLASPASEILSALGGEGLTMDALLTRLCADYDLIDADRSALVERVEELVAAGLVSAA
jgi:PqqD family protein of HPr-rel-A system